MDKAFICSISTCSIYVIERLKTFYSFAPVVTFYVQLTIGILTIIYLIKQIKNKKQ